MASVIPTEAYNLFDQWPSLVHAVSSVTSFIFLLTVVIFLYVILLRVRNNLRERERKEFKQKWRGIIFEWMSGNRTEANDLSYRYQLLLLDTWYGIRHLIDDESATELNDFATAFRLDETVAGILQYRSYNDENRKIWLQLLAVHVARAMHSELAIEALLRASVTSNFRVNVAATCALVELRHEQADLSVLSSMMQFQSWVPYIVTRVSMAGGSDILHLIGEQMDYMDAEQGRNLISLTEASDDRSLLPLLVETLSKTDDIQEQASILRTLGRLGDHSHVKYITPYLHNENPILRLRAVAALGKLGDSNDLPLILPLCADDNWWLRYRAAESYLLISKPDANAFQTLISTLAAPASDMFKHVYTELNNA